MTPVEVLQAAKAALTPKTWWRGKPYEANKVCLGTAIARQHYGTLRYAKQAVAQLGFPERTCEEGTTFGAIPRFNDHPDTTLDDVQWALDIAIDLAKAELQE